MACRVSAGDGASPMDPSVPPEPAEAPAAAAAPSVEGAAGTSGSEAGQELPAKSRLANVVACIRSFLPSSKPSSPPPAAGKRVVKVRWAKSSVTSCRC